LLIALWIASRSGSTSPFSDVIEKLEQDFFQMGRQTAAGYPSHPIFLQPSVILLQIIVQRNDSHQYGHHPTGHFEHGVLSVPDRPKNLNGETPVSPKKKDIEPSPSDKGNGHGNQHFRKRG
jgi:hypothetical protein